MSNWARRTTTTVQTTAITGAKGAILEVHTKDNPLAPDVDLGLIASSTPGFSGADLANLVNEAALGATRRGANSVERRDFRAAYDKIVLGDPRETKLDPDPQKVIQDSRRQVLESFEGYAYEILDEVEGTTDGGFPYLDIKINDNDSLPWLKRARIYALHKTVVRLEYYCPIDQFDTRDAIFTRVVGTFEYDPQWITEEPSNYYSIPVDEIYEYGEFEWVEYEDEQYGFMLNVPDFLEWEYAEDVVFFNYNYESIITVVIEAYPGFNRDEALSAGEGSAETEFALMWEYTRHGDAAGIMSGSAPYVDFYMDDNDPEGSWVKHVRVIGTEELAIRIEMYRPIHQTGLLDMLFADVVESLQFSPV